MRRAVLVTVGSLGDLHPFLAIALRLREAGLHPVVASHAEYREKVENAGIEFLAVRPSLDDLTATLALTRAEMTRRAIANPVFIYRALVFPYLRQSYDDLARFITDDDIVVTSSLAFSARFIAEQRALRWIAVVLQPMLFLSAFDPPVMPGVVGNILRKLRPRTARFVIDLILFLSRPLLRRIDRFRTQVGLPHSASNPAFGGQFSTAGAIGLYSDVLGRAQADYPVPTRVIGFPWFDSEDGLPPRLSAALQMFLDDDVAPPLVMTLGSVASEIGDRLFTAAILAARDLQRRIVVLAGEGGAARLAALASREVFVGCYEPHSLVFSCADVIIHHGGIGTLAQALRAGRPQLIVPILADQADNAARAVALGVARTLSRRRFTQAKVATALTQLTTDQRVAIAAKAIGAHVAREDGAKAAAGIIAGAAGSRS